MPWGASKEKKEEKEPEVTEEEVLAFMINESTNDTLESTRYISQHFILSLQTRFSKQHAHIRVVGGVVYRQPPVQILKF